MKKLLIILATGCIFASCSKVSDGQIVTHVDFNNGNADAYYTTSGGGQFYAIRNLYSVGDTVHFCKR